MPKPSERPPHVDKFVWDTLSILKKPTPAKVEPEPERRRGVARPTPVVRPTGMSFRQLVRAFEGFDLGGEGSGNFGHAGRPGEVGGSASSNDKLDTTTSARAAAVSGDLKAETDAGGRFETREQRIAIKLDLEQRLAKLATGTGPEGYIPVNIMGAEPNLIRAGEHVEAVLAEMKVQGLEMPNAILIRHTDGNVQAAIRGTRIQDAGSSEVSFKKDLIVEIPTALPDDVSLDDAVMATFSEPSTVSPLHAYGDHDYKTYDRFTARTMADIVIHEMGHVQAGHRGEIPFADLLNKGAFRSMDEIRRATMRVSEYAKTNQDEFLAESFTRLYRGETLAEDSQKLYDRLNGPKVPTP